MLKILLNSPSNFTTSSELLTNPIGLSYIKSLCEERFDCSITIVPVITDALLKKEQPHIVGISCYAATYDRVKAIAKKCRTLGINVVVGGEQITTLPHLLTPDMDVGVLGEGEFVFLELLNRYQKGWRCEDLGDLDGVVFVDNNNDLKVNKPGKGVDLNQLPVPDLLYGNEQSDILCLMSSRGCPYNCSFCATGWHRNVHWMSPEKIVETIQYHVERYPKIRRVKFWDDLFTVNLKRVEMLAELFNKHGFNKTLNVTVCTRSDHVNEPLVKLLKKMNCDHVSMGLESGSDDTLKYIAKKTTVKQNEAAVRLLNRYGIYSESSFIIGFPHETETDIQKTYDFIKAIPINKIQVFLPIPYPGTRIWRYAEEHGLVSEQMDWKRLDLIATMNDPKSILTDFVVISKNLSPKTLYGWLLRFRRLRKIKTFKFALLLLFKNPGIIFQRLRREIVFFYRKIRYN